MKKQITLYTLEQSIKKEITCETNDRTQYKGILLKMYRNLDCMLEKTEVKYSDERIEHKESVFIRGTKIALFILPPFSFKDISNKLEEKLGEKQKDSKPSKGKGKSKGKKKSKTSSNTQHQGTSSSSRDQSQASQDPPEPIQEFESSLTVPSYEFLPQQSPLVAEQGDYSSAPSWQPQPAYEHYQQQSQWVSGTAYPLVQTSGSYSQQYMYPYPQSQTRQGHVPSTMLIPAPGVQSPPTPQARTYQRQGHSTIVYYSPYQQPPSAAPQPTHQMQAQQSPIPSNIYPQAYPQIQPHQMQAQRPPIPSNIYPQAYPQMQPHQMQAQQPVIPNVYGQFYQPTQYYQMQQPQHPDPNVYHQTYQMPAVQHPPPAQTYPPTRSLPTQQQQHSDPNADQEAYPPTRSSQMP